MLYYCRILRILAIAVLFLFLTATTANAQETKPEAAEEAAETPPAEPEPPPPPTTGSVVLTVDQDGLSATVGGQTQKLVVGENRFENINAGSVKIVVTNAAGQTVHETQVELAGGGQAAAGFKVFSMVKSNLTDATLSPEKAESDTKEPQGQSVLKLKEGEHTLTLARPGHYSLKGKLQVSAGKDIIVLNQTNAIPDRSQMRLYSWIGVGLGLAMVGTATVMEIAKVGDSGAADAAKFALAGVGGAMFVTGGSLLKWIVDEKNTPKDGEFKVKIGAAPIKEGAIISAVGKF